MKRWDIFISHASEDRASVAIPLGTMLRSAGLNVWIDGAELRLGDSLRAKIDEGLANSRFGVVILSPDFFRKKWPLWEFNGLFAREEEESNVILPVWHHISRREILQHSPLLADRLAVDTAEGIEQVARAICRAVSQAGARGTGGQKSLAFEFSELLNAATPIDGVLEFLESNEAIVRAALGRGSRPYTNPDGVVDQLVWWTWRTHPEGPHTLIADWQGTSKTYAIEAIIFGSPHDPLFIDPSTPSTELIRCTRLAQALRDGPAAPIRIDNFLSSRKSVFGNYPLRSIDHFTVVASRRSTSGLAFSEMRVLRDYTDHLQKVDVRTYDWLIDVAVRLSAENRP